MKNKKSGFTLGEVLLAVAIVGLIAALTIPNLNKNINEDKYIALMKATMGQLDAAVAKIVSEYGSLDNAAKSCNKNFATACFGNILTKYLDTRKVCSSSDKSCFSTEPMKDVYGNAVKDRGDEGETASDPCKYNFILSNGVAVCLRGVYGVSLDESIDIDVDGPNAGPNMRGVDNFEFVLNNDGVSYFDVSIFKSEYENAESPGYEQTIQASRRDIDRGFKFEYDSVAWAFLNGNMDYLRCADQLKWHSKKTCD